MLLVIALIGLSSLCRELVPPLWLLPAFEELYTSGRCWIWGVAQDWSLLNYDLCPLPLNENVVMKKMIQARERGIYGELICAET